MPYKTRDDVKLHLLQYGFIANYTNWWAHGEKTRTLQHEVQLPNPMEDDDFDGKGVLFFPIFKDAYVIRSIPSILKTMFNGPWTTWKDVDAINSETLWQHFKGLYQWDPYKYTDEVIHDAWKEVMKSCFSESMTNALKEFVILAKAKNANALEKWKRKSDSRKENRSKMEHGSISKHCCGSIPISHHRDKLESELKCPPSRLDLFNRTHRTKKPKESTSNNDYVTPKPMMSVDEYTEGIVAKYGDDIDSHPPYDHELWVKVTGGIKK
ncbi:unnamed protein product [Lactuca virosa]|uniref:Transposase-associated domain-containing protein n=1 Tax=Lactuca virosa TaxID=75947 RepID=A0AAU9PLL4_9ASTR|nr:unnamed protein product [Lactuca virosa]